MIKDSIYPAVGMLLMDEPEIESEPKPTPKTETKTAPKSSEITPRPAPEVPSGECDNNYLDSFISTFTSVQK